MGVVASLAAVSATIVVAIDVVLLAFLSIVFAVFLTRLASILQNRMAIPYAASLTSVVALLLITAIGVGYFCGARIEDQLQNVEDEFNAATETLKDNIRRKKVLRMAVASIPGANEILRDTDEVNEEGGGENSNEAQLRDTKPQTTDMQTTDMPTTDMPTTDTPTTGSSPGTHQSPIGLDRLPVASQNLAERFAGAVGKLFATTFGLLADITFVLFATLFIAASPKKYQNGLVRLFPMSRRPRIEQVTKEMGEAIWRWMLGRLIAMCITGVGTGLTLVILDVPLALTLGVVTAVVTFIPNVGAIVSLVLAVLVALPIGTDTVCWVVVSFAALQLIESNVVTPLVQQRQVAIPPALLIAFQLVMAATTGVFGIIIASPLLAIGLVGVRRLYVEDVLQANATPGNS